jgi:muramoyltetrapeptide carboxypeptidase LdcA involved in peptidoglycan recycling
VVMRICGHLGVPVAYGMRSGHVTRRNITLPIGVSASFEVAENAASLRITEAAVSVK